MTSLILPDSSAYIRAFRAGRDPFQEFAAGVETRDLEFATCGVVMLEVCRGLRQPGLLARIRERFAVMIFLPTTPRIWDRATQLARSLDRQGVVLPATDLIIAACALHVGATVLTTDAHFHAVPGLAVVAAFGPE